MQSTYKKQIKVGVAILAGSLAFASMPSFANGSFLVAPGRLEVNLEKPATNTLIVTNNGDERIRLSFVPEYIPVEGKGGLGVGKNLSPNINDDLEDYITVSPKVVNLEPGQRRDVKVNINGKYSRTNPNAKPLTEAGDYRAHIIVKMNEIAEKKKIKDAGSDGVSMNLNIKFETAVAAYGRIGDSDYSKVTASCSGNGVNVINPSKFKVDAYTKKGDKTYPFVLMRETERTLEKPNDGHIYIKTSSNDGKDISVVCK